MKVDYWMSEDGACHHAGGVWMGEQLSSPYGSIGKHFQHTTMTHVLQCFDERTDSGVERRACATLLWVKGRQMQRLFLSAIRYRKTWLCMLTLAANLPGCCEKPCFRWDFLPSSDEMKTLPRRCDGVFETVNNDGLLGRHSHFATSVLTIWLLTILQQIMLLPYCHRHF